MKTTATRLTFLASLFCVVAACAAPAGKKGDTVKNGDAIAFLGDSITQQGNTPPGGYIHLVVDGFKAAGIEVKPIPAGISGHKSNDMLVRVDRDVISKKPQWMTLSCGVNDVWHGANGVPLDAFKENITALVDKADAAGIKIMILTATMIMEDPDTANNKKLAPYNDFLRKLAQERGYRLADLSADMIAGVRKGKRYTYDGVHMSFEGNKMMASGILRAFGMTEAAIAACNARWDDLPGTAKITLPLSERQRKALADKAAATRKTMEEVVLERLGAK